MVRDNEPAARERYGDRVPIPLQKKIRSGTLRVSGTVTWWRYGDMIPIPVYFSSGSWRDSAGQTKRPPSRRAALEMSFASLIGLPFVCPCRSPARPSAVDELSLTSGFEVSPCFDPVGP